MKSVEEWSDQEIETWFSESKWNNELSMKPDASVNKRLFVEQNVLNPDAWEVAYRFLNNNDLNSLESGRYDLFANGTYANIQEYTTKDSAHFEAHREYIDIQYLSKGKEYVHVAPFDTRKQTGVKAYDSSRDIEFFDRADYKRRLLSTDNFLVLFPSDGHRPCMKVDTNEVVRKIVVKIPVASSRIGDSSENLMNIDWLRFE